MPTEPLYVTQSYLPPFEEFVAQMRQVWQTAQLTNNGPLVCEYESRLKELLGVDHIVSVDNGDAGLRVAYKALRLSGEVITTPFSYISTTSSLLWSGLKPVFADVEEDTLTLDPECVMAAITSRTTAILATHVYGNPCDVRRLAQLADQHGLKLIFDAAHAFGVRYEGQPILAYGDVSMVSLHATKLVHAAEGGILATNDSKLAEDIEWRRRFGHDGTESYHGVGINAKMSELHAGLGLCVLRHIDEIVAARRRISACYDSLIDELGLPFCYPKLRPETDYNFAYYPVLLESAEQLTRVLTFLNSQNIYPRRYFFPSMNTIKTLGDFPRMPVSEAVSSKVLCLPLSASMTEAQVDRVVRAIAFAVGN